MLFATTLILSIISTFPSTGLAAGVQFAGVNIAGFDFGCSTDGSCLAGGQNPPLASPYDGPAQMRSMVANDKMNMFRLPVGWQYLADAPGGPLNDANLAQYDKLVSACLATGAHCIIDLHNYARWDGQIVGQGGPSNAAFGSFWGAIASKYASNAGIVFGIMNEPHDIPDAGAWAQSVQAAITAIRGAGASSQMILMPSNFYSAAGSVVASGCAEALGALTNPDGSKTGLIFDLHTYFDSDGSGTVSTCTTNKIQDGFAVALPWLRANNRQALVTELGGGGSDEGCLQYVCQALDFFNENSDVYLGWTAWSAGAFTPEYALSLLNADGSQRPLMTTCFAGKFAGGSGVISASATTSNTVSSVVSNDNSNVSSGAVAGIVPVASNIPIASLASSTNPVNTAEEDCQEVMKVSRRFRKRRIVLDVNDGYI